jgi:hypothetical protein
MSYDVRIIYSELLTYYFFIPNGIVVSRSKQNTFRGEELDSHSVASKLIVVFGVLVRNFYSQEIM